MDLPWHRRALRLADNGQVRTSAIIFDFDGLLMATETSMLESWQAEWRQHGLELDLGTFWVDHGGDVTEDRYRRLAAAAGPGYDRAASHARRVAHRDELHRQLGLNPGISGWLADAATAGLRLAVASSSPVWWVRQHLAAQGVLGRFAVIAGGDEVAAAKPAPDVYLLALARLGLEPGGAVAVEDAPHGVAAAQAAGLRCIAIPNPHADRGRFGAAELVLGSAAELGLPEALGRIGS
jgi:beta-phosphoglucomutase-like phosphatase (HAD superfamily)